MQLSSTSALAAVPFDDPRIPHQPPPRRPEHRRSLPEHTVPLAHELAEPGPDVFAHVGQLDRGGVETGRDEVGCVGAGGEEVCGWGVGEEEEEAEGEAVEQGEREDVGCCVGVVGGSTREEQVGEGDSSAGREDAMCLRQEGGAGIEAAEGSRPSVPAGVGGECRNRAQLVSAVDGEDCVL